MAFIPLLHNEHLAAEIAGTANSPRGMIARSSVQITI
jgi:hypothetical protein